MTSQATGFEEGRNISLKIDLLGKTKRRNRQQQGDRDCQKPNDPYRFAMYNVEGKHIAHIIFQAAFFTNQAVMNAKTSGRSLYRLKLLLPGDQITAEVIPNVRAEPPTPAFPHWAP